MKKGVIKQSRNESNFVKRMADEKRDRYIKDWIARCNQQDLVPLIKITKHDRYYRTVRYEINTGDSVEKGITYNSRRESDNILSLSNEQREQSIKRFIAACNPKLLIPFIEITAYDPDNRTIEYQINIERIN